MREKISRRDFLRWGALAMGGVALASCAPQATPTTAPAAEKEAEPQVEAQPAPAEGVTLEFWAGWGHFARVWEDLQALDEFEELLGNNTVELKTAFGAEVLLTAVAGGTPPDAASNVAYLDYYARGVLLPVGDLVSLSSIIRKEGFLEGNWENGFWEGVQYGVPGIEGFVRYALCYNGRLVEAAGLDPDEPPTTWEECLEWHQKLTEFDSAGNLIRVGLDPYDAMGGSIDFANGFFASMSWGFDWFDEDAGSFNLANDMMAEAFEVMGEFYRIAGPDNMAAMRQVDGQGMWGGSINTEVQAMIIDGNWFPGLRANEKPEVAEHVRVNWAPVPSARKGAKVQGYGGHYILLFSDAQHPVEAFKIAEFVNTAAACEVIFTGLGFLPASRPALEKIDPTAYNGLEFFFRSLDEATDWHTPAGCPMTAYVQTQYTELREAVYRDEMTGSQAAEEFQRRCESEYKAAGFA